MYVYEIHLSCQNVYLRKREKMKLNGDTNQQFKSLYLLANNLTLSQLRPSVLVLDHNYLVPRHVHDTESESVMLHGYH